MQKHIAAVFILISTPILAECITKHSQIHNVDGSVMKMIQRQCEDNDTRSILVQLKPPKSTKFKTVLRRMQMLSDAPTGGGRLRDLDGDGIFEYEEIGACGAGPNCEGWVFKMAKGQTKMHLLFHEEGYAEFQHIANFYVTSGRAGAGTWEHHLYKQPNTEHTIKEQDFLYSITVGGDADIDESSKTPCFVYRRIKGKWVESPMPDKRLLSLCEVYGPDYIINPTRSVE